MWEEKSDLLFDAFNLRSDEHLPDTTDEEYEEAVASWEASASPEDLESGKGRPKKQQFGLENSLNMAAPLYDKTEITDSKLIKILESLKVKPKFLLLNLGGGVQERLGFYIKNNLSYQLGIICTGAAIAFETGSQAKLPKWVDELYLGWLARIIQSPKQFSIRFLKAFRLVYVFYLCKINKL